LISPPRYPRHLTERLFAVVVHGDTEGIMGVRRATSDWLISMRLKSAGIAAELDRNIGYWKPYATTLVSPERPWFPCSAKIIPC
jgi:hypothetical protein